MMGYFTHCFRGRSDNVGETKPVYRDDLNEKPLHQKEGSKPVFSNTSSSPHTTTRKTKKVVRFADHHTTIEPPREREGLRPRNNVPRLRVETLAGGEGLPVEEKMEEIIRVKIKMPKHEAERLLSKHFQNGAVLGLRHVADQIANVPFHRVHVATAVVVARNMNDKGGGVEAGVINYNKNLN